MTSQNLRVLAVAAGAAVCLGVVLSARPFRDSPTQTPGPTPGSGVLTGVVLTDTADPMPVRRATVRLSSEILASPRLVGTDNEGRFAFDGLPAGTFTLVASKAGFVQAFHGSTQPGRGPAVPVAVADGAKVAVSIRLLPGGVITGTITDLRGTAAQGVPVSAVQASGASGELPVPIRTVTDDRGVYRIAGLIRGDYFVSALPTLLPAGSGRGVPANDVVTAVTDAEVQWARSVGSTGGVGGGGAPPAVTSGRPVAYAPVFFPGTTDAAGAATVRVASGEERAGVDLALRIVPLSRVAGTMVDANGQAITSAQVMLVPKRGAQPSPVDALVTPPRASVSASGFAFSGVTPGQYTLIARTGSGQRGAVAAEAAVPTQWSVTDLSVDGGDRTDVALRLLPGLTVTGRYVFEPGAAPPPAVAVLNLSLVAINPLPGVASTFRAVAQPDGTFRVSSLAPGTYVARIQPQTGSGGARWSLKSAISGDRDLADRPLPAPADGSHLSGVLVTFSDRTATISGRLVDPGNRPVTRYSIVIATTDRWYWLPQARRIVAVQPATDGTFAARDLPVGEYAIAAVRDLSAEDLSNEGFLAGVLQSGYTMTLAEGETKRQDLRVEQ